MASFVFNQFKHMLLDDNSTSGTVFKENDINTSATFIMALVTNDILINHIYGNNKYIENFYSNWDIGASVNSATYHSSGYSPKRVYVTNAGDSTEMMSIKYVKFADVSTSGSNIIWPNSTIDAYGAVIYKESTSANVCFIDFGGKKTSNNSNFQITQNTNGFISLQ